MLTFSLNLFFSFYCMLSSSCQLYIKYRVLVLIVNVNRRKGSMRKRVNFDKTDLDTRGLYRVPDGISFKNEKDSFLVSHATRTLLYFGPRILRLKKFTIFKLGSLQQSVDINHSN